MSIDLAKRRRIMQRSMKLGHCICDPRRGCPCDIFRDQGICPCAGERLDPKPLDEIHLTQLVHNAGCASKIAPADLEAVLNRLPEVNDPAVLCGLPAGDDAGVYRLDENVHLVQTVDVMTPCVDDPETFGRICAANCLSDIYAMGGRPRTALSILAFPSETLHGQIMYEMMKGAMDVFAEADVALIGGHSIKDEEIKLGFAITGTIAPDRIARQDAAQPGDVLILTKPLGCGVINFAHQIGRECSAGLAAGIESMATLNRAAAEAMESVGISACTDVTGFGLFGHLAQMVRGSEVTAQIFADALPALAGSVEFLREGIVPGAIERNREFVGEDIEVAGDVDEARVDLGFDAQTSGGLLIAVAADKVDSLTAALQDKDVQGVVVGKITEASEGKIIVTNSDTPACSCTSAATETEETTAVSCCGSEDHGPGCCADVFGETTTQNSSTLASKKAFGAFMQTVAAGGRIDERTKELINFVLTVHARCTPCVKAHLAKARNMGIERDELDEAVWLAAAMGGAPIWMFYNEVMAEEQCNSPDKPCCS